MPRNLGITRKNREYLQILTNIDINNKFKFDNYFFTISKPLKKIENFVFKPLSSRGEGTPLTLVVQPLKNTLF